MNPEEQTKELYAAKPFVLRCRYDGDPGFMVKCHYAKMGKTLQEFMVWLAADQPHLRCIPFWADGGRPAVEVVPKPGEHLVWKMPAVIPEARLIPLLVERKRLDERINAEIARLLPATESHAQHLNVMANANHLAERYIDETGGEEGLEGFLFRLSYETAGKKL